MIGGYREKKDIVENTLRDLDLYHLYVVAPGGTRNGYRF